MQRIAATVNLAGRTYSLVVTTVGVKEDVVWYEGQCFCGEATQLEAALGLALEKTRKQLVRALCGKDKGIVGERDCFDCPDVDCESYWGPDASPLPVRRRLNQKESFMPPKKQVKAAIKKGTNPYAVAQSMVNKGKIPASKKEQAVKSITKSVLKGKRKSKGMSKGKSHGKMGGSKRHDM